MDRHPDTLDHPEGRAAIRRAAPRLTAGVIAVLLAAAVFATPAGAQATRPGDPAQAENQFLQLLNQERAAAGRAPLQSHPNLVRDARAWSGVMAQQNRLFHTSTLASDTTRSIPDWTRAGENVGRGWSVETLHSSFVASASHYANVVGDFNYVGVGVVYTADRTYVTFRFAKGPTSTVVAGTAATNTVSATEAAGQVRRLYLAFFEREPDSAGSTFWVTKIMEGFPLGQISAEFIKSAEFRTTYGHLTDGQFITMVYKNVLGRAPDASGYDYWVQRMAQGMGRGSVMVNFSESAEFRTKTA
jgi:uncharacterized protein YkwD